MDVEVREEVQNTVVVVVVEVRDEVRTNVVVVVVFDDWGFVVDVSEVVTDAEGVIVVVTEGILPEVVPVGREPVSVAAAEEVCAGTEVPVVLLIPETVCTFVVEDDVTAPEETSGKTVCAVCVIEVTDAETVLPAVVCVTGSDADVRVISKLFNAVVVTADEF